MLERFPKSNTSQPSNIAECHLERGIASAGVNKEVSANAGLSMSMVDQGNVIRGETTKRARKLHKYI